MFLKVASSGVVTPFLSVSFLNLKCSRKIFFRAVVRLLKSSQYTSLVKNLKLPTTDLSPFFLHLPKYLKNLGEFFLTNIMCSNQRNKDFQKKKITTYAALDVTI